MHRTASRDREVAEISTQRKAFRCSMGHPRDFQVAGIFTNLGDRSSTGIPAI
jgi:hypothetical protein